MEPRRRILHVSQPVDDGVAVVLGDLVDHQVEAGWDVVVASPDNGQLAPRVRRSGGLHLSWQASREPGASLVGEVRRLSRIIAVTDPHVIHLHSSKSGLAGRLAIRGRRPTVFSPHAWSFYHVAGPTRRAALEWERRAARWSDVVLCGSSDELDAGVAAGIEARYEVIANQSYIAHPGLSQLEAREILGLDPEQPLVLCFGRFARQKGQDVLIAAWPEVRREVPGAGLAFLGSGREEGRLRSLASPDITFTPAGDRRDVATWMLSADVLVFPSRWETLSLAVLEALQLGRAVVVSDCGGMAEALAGGEGVMVPKESPSALAAAIIPFVADRQWAAQQGRRAGEKFALVHGRTRDEKLARYLEMLTELIRDP